MWRWKKYIYGNECVPVCPSNKNKIGQGNRCLELCSSDGNGENYKEITNPLAVDYRLYECIVSCSNEEYYLL